MNFVDSFSDMGNMGVEGDEDHWAVGRLQIVVSAFAVVTLAVLTQAWISKRKEGLRSYRVPPGPKGWPVVGVIPSLGDLPHQTFFRWAKIYGPVMYFHIGSVPTVVISSPSMARETLKTNDQICASRPTHIVSTYLSYGKMDVGFANYGSHWRSARKLCTLELFTAVRINQFQGTRQVVLEATLRSILTASKEETVLNMQNLFSNLTTNFMTQMMWNKTHFLPQGGSSPKDGNEFPKIMREILSLIGTVNIGDYIPFLAPVSMNLQGLGKRMKNVHQKMDTFLESAIQEHQQTYIQGAPSRDFLDVLLKSMKSGRSELGKEQAVSRDTIKAILWDMIIAGTDTTAVTLEWGLAELMKKPDTMRRAQDELSAVVGRDRLVTEADLPNLKYLQAVVKETLRLHPPTPLALPHESTHECEIGGFRIPARSLIFVSLWAIHRDPDAWERPFEFDPDRFLVAANTRDVRGVDFELLPFGSGRRICPALNLGLNMVHYSLAHFLHTFDWTPVGMHDNKTQINEQLVDMREGVGMVAQKEIPLMVSVKPRLCEHVILSHLCSSLK